VFPEAARAGDGKKRLRTGRYGVQEGKGLCTLCLLPAVAGLTADGVSWRPAGGTDAFRRHKKRAHAVERALCWLDLTLSGASARRCEEEERKHAGARSSVRLYQGAAGVWRAAAPRPT
jgi:hypothetical protein